MQNDKKCKNCFWEGNCINNASSKCDYYFDITDVDDTYVECECQIKKQEFQNEWNEYIESVYDDVIRLYDPITYRKHRRNEV